MRQGSNSTEARRAGTPSPVRLSLCGDVMLGRGVDQILPHPGDPHIYESCLHSAADYVELAEAANGPMRRAVEFSYVWGDALDVWRRAAPNVRIVNLETAITRSEDYEVKGINYRMHPDNVPVLNAAAIDCCALANNHVLDWGGAGLRETLASLKTAGIACAGAGEDIAQASAPAIVPLGSGARVLVFALGSPSSGIPARWAATRERPGINLLAELSQRAADAIAAQVAAVKRPGDIAIASLHWGANWGYRIEGNQRSFAHALIERAGIDVVHGHSAHHAKAIEIYRGRAILYGCGDFLNDYEGIKGYEEFRDDLALMYFLDVAARDGRLAGLQIVPLQIRRFRLHRAAPKDTKWICQVLNREGREFQSRFDVGEDGSLRLIDPS